MNVATASKSCLEKRLARSTARPISPHGRSKEAEKRLAAAILEVLAGVRTPQQAAEALQMSLPRYYQLEARGLHGLLEACVPKPKGRQPNPASEMDPASAGKRALAVRPGPPAIGWFGTNTARSIGISPPPPPLPEVSGQEGAGRKPVVRGP